MQNMQAAVPGRTAETQAPGEIRFPYLTSVGLELAALGGGKDIDKLSCRARSQRMTSFESVGDQIGTSRVDTGSHQSSL